jgi:hypothetical protein
LFASRGSGPFDSAGRLSIAAVRSLCCPDRTGKGFNLTSRTGLPIRMPGLVGRIFPVLRRCPDVRWMYGTPRVSEPHPRDDPSFGGLPLFTERRHWRGSRLLAQSKVLQPPDRAESNDARVL